MAGHRKDIARIRAVTGGLVVIRHSGLPQSGESGIHIR